MASFRTFGIPSSSLIAGRDTWGGQHVSSLVQNLNLVLRSPPQQLNMRAKIQLPAEIRQPRALRPVSDDLVSNIDSRIQHLPNRA
jgi:hypothetical protein